MSVLSGIYALAVNGRNQLYDHGILRARRLNGPVISVGNISAGGAGKTPFVILLGELLKHRGLAFDVLSRGYARNTKGVLLVDPNGSAADFGDEPLLIAQRLGCRVVVGENRYDAGAFAERNFGPQLHILDDGFQHRSLARDFDIVLVTPEDLKDHLLPKGRLREPLAALKRADVIVVIGDLDAAALPVSGKPMWRVRRGIDIESPPQRPLVFCGIARPQRLIDQLREHGIHPVAQKAYSDHHSYSDEDICDLLNVQATANADGFITTEKDLVNLGSKAGRLGRLTIAKVTMEILEPANALDTLLHAIRETGPQA